MIRRDIVVIGGSAGSLRPLSVLLNQLPELPAVFLMVVHSAGSIWNTVSLQKILAREMVFPVRIAQDQGRMELGNLYICPADLHLTLENDLMHLAQGPKENHARPSIDVLFRSAAVTFGRRTIGVLLSGSLRDGVAGLWQIRQRGGVTIVQHPGEADFPSMPKSAMDTGAVDYVLPAQKMAGVLTDIIRQGASAASRQPSVLIVEDEGLVARNLKDQLIAAGYGVEGIARTGEAAVQLADETNPDLVLMDIRLQGEMTGIQAVRTIWESLQIPAVFVTANADSATLDQVKTVPHYGYVVKPFHTASLRAVLELALDRREKELRLAPAARPHPVTT